MSEAPRLRVRGLASGYPSSGDVVRDLDLDVKPGETMVIVGPNGAGKTTLLKTLAGLLTARHGTIELDDVDVTRLSAEQRVQKFGMSLVPEGRELFPSLTVGDHMLIGARGRGHRDGERWDRRKFEMFPELGDRVDAAASQLSGGQQQMVAILRSLLCAPRLIMFDEPSLGLSPKLSHDIYAVIRAAVRERDLTAIIVEQEAVLAWEIATRVVVLAQGEKVVDKPRDEFTSVDELRSSYFGLQAPVEGSSTRGAFTSQEDGHE